MASRDAAGQRRGGTHAESEENMTASRAGNVVVGVFEQPADAEKAVAALWQAGFAHDRLDMVTPAQGKGPGTPRLAIQQDAGEGAWKGAAIGAAAGAAAGLITGLLIPGLGTVLAGGLLVAIVGGAALGAAGGSFLGPFLALEMSEDDAHHYSRQVQEGRTVVLVHTVDRQEEARALLRSHGAVEHEQPARHG
jgi:hypothetical protein